MGASRQYHAYAEYLYPAGITGDKHRFYKWFADRAFKPAFDRILDQLPDFRKLDQCLIHTDLGPHNVIMTPDGRPILIDLDDAGLGSRFLDLGYALICQFVEHDNEMNLWYRFDCAKAFLEGYYGEEEIVRGEYDLLWSGAAYMQISYMKCYGDDAVDSLWKILEFGLAQKEALWDTLKEAYLSDPEIGEKRPDRPKLQAGLSADDIVSQSGDTMPGKSMITTLLK